MPTREPAHPPLAKTAAKALDVLECLAVADTPLTAQNVADRLAIARPTAYRFLQTLIERGYAERVGDHHYRLGTKILRLSRRVLDRLEIASLATPILRELREKTGEMSLAAIRDGDSVFYVAKYETTHTVRMESRVGTQGHLHSTALGKAILAFLPAEERTSLLARLPLPKVTAKTITDPIRLESHLEEVQRRGIAVEDEENEADIRAVAAPVFNHMGEVVGAVATAGPAYRLDLRRLGKIGRHVEEAAARISYLLGHAQEQAGESSGLGGNVRGRAAAKGAPR